MHQSLGAAMSNGFGIIIGFSHNDGSNQSGIHLVGLSGSQDMVMERRLRIFDLNVNLSEKFAFNQMASHNKKSCLSLTALLVQSTDYHG